MPQHLPPFLPGETYHVYNHANGDDNIFREEDNYRYFLEKYKKYISPVADTLAYCLMKNHFHLMVRIKEEESLINFFDVKNPDLTGFQNLSGLVSRQFSKLFNSYSKAFNKKYNRIGGLFNRPVKRKQITNNSYFTSLIVYIHNNPVHHGFVEGIGDWKHASYDDMLQENDHLVKTAEIIEWFGNKEAFVAAHHNVKMTKSVFD